MVAIIGIIAAIAIPNYLDYVQNTRRTDARVLLAEAAGEQFRYYSGFNTYAPSMTVLGYSADATETEEGLYTVSVDSADANSFELVATPVAGEPQANDTDCLELRIDSSGLKTPADCW